jgi:hypothetical protein
MVNAKYFTNFFSKSAFDLDPSQRCAGGFLGWVGASWLRPPKINKFLIIIILNIK